MAGVPTQGRSCPRMDPPTGIPLQKHNLTPACGPLDPARPEGLGFSVTCTNTHPSCLGCCGCLESHGWKSGDVDQEQAMPGTLSCSDQAEGTRALCSTPGDSRAQARGRQSTASRWERLLTCAGLAMVSGSATEYTVEKKETS